MNPLHNSPPPAPSEAGWPGSYISYVATFSTLTTTDTSSSTYQLYYRYIVSGGERTGE